MSHGWAFGDEVVEIIREVPKIEKRQKFVDVPTEVPKVEYIDKIVEVPQGGKVAKHIEVPEIRYIDKISEGIKDSHERLLQEATETINADAEYEETLGQVGQHVGGQLLRVELEFEAAFFLIPVPQSRVRVVDFEWGGGGISMGMRCVRICMSMRAVCFECCRENIFLCEISHDLNNLGFLF